MLDKLLGGMLGEAKSTGDSLQRDFSSEWVVRSLASAALKYTLSAALAQGPPETLAADLGLSGEAAKQLYERVLVAAIRRL